MADIGIYLIELNGKKYVGSTAEGFKRRQSRHLSYLRIGKHTNRHLQRAFNKYGEAALTFSILEIVETPEECIVIEQKYIDKLKPEYNMCPIARSCLGITRSVEAKKKMSQAQMGRVFSEEAKRKMSESTKGFKHTDETKKKMSIAHMGKKTSLGYKHTEKAKARIHEKTAGINNPFYGKKHTDESKRKMRERTKT